MSEELKAKLGAALHEMWSGWMKEMITEHGDYGPRGMFVVKADMIEKWHRESEMNYDQLPEEQRVLDNADVMKLISLYAEYPATTIVGDEGSAKFKEVLEEEKVILQDTLDDANETISTLENELSDSKDLIAGLQQDIVDISDTFEDDRSPNDEEVDEDDVSEESEEEAIEESDEETDTEGTEEIQEDTSEEESDSKE